MVKTAIFSKFALLLCLGFMLSACTQSTKNSSAYNARSSISSAKDPKQASILAARKRARAIKEAKADEFNKRRYGKSYTKKRTRVRQRSNRRISKKSKRTKSTKRKYKRIKKSSYAYVGGHSKGISKQSKPWKCVPRRLKRVISQISKKYGRVVINSTHRSRRHNRRVGGKRRSYHLRCQAVDFRVHGRTRGLTRWLANHPDVGGYNRYPSGYYHIDTGPKRTW